MVIAKIGKIKKKERDKKITIIAMITTMPKLNHISKNITKTMNLLAEAIIIGGKPYFAIAAPKFGAPDAKSSIILHESIPLNDNIVLKPPDFISYINKPIYFQVRTGISTIHRCCKEGNTRQLIHEGKINLEKYIDADDFHLSIGTADTIYTYYQDKIGLTHYLFFVGNNSSGKSNNLRAFQFLAYRNMTSTDMTANIYQFLGEYGRRTRDNL